MPKFKEVEIEVEEKDVDPLPPQLKCPNCNALVDAPEHKCNICNYQIVFVIKSNNLYA